MHIARKTGQKNKQSKTPEISSSDLETLLKQNKCT